VVELGHSDSVAIRGTPELAPEARRSLENSLSLLHEKVLEERPAEVRVVEDDPSEGGA
jgi:hypothetical protein